MAVSRRKFRTEVQQLLDLVIHSLYSNQDIFLRELISNASDAVDRCRFEALSRKELIEDDPAWKIKVVVDEDNRQLVVSDNGIGMSREEVESNIGTIANSGTRAFLDELKSGKAANAPELIGQFGVGFYASFMVADKVTLITRRAGTEEAFKWQSAGDGTYTLQECQRDGRGTDVILHLREGCDEFLEEWKLRKIIKQYSDFVEYPVVMDISHEEKPKDDDGKIIEDAEPLKTVEEETINSMKAIWMRAKSEVSDEQYNEFYKHISHDYVDPQQTIPYAAEGTLEYRALMFIPARAPFDLFFQDQRKGLHLYVRRVFITDDCKELLPEYLRFVKGVVESNDLPLNVSRELLQENRIIEKMRKGLVGKILGSLTEMKEKKPDDYITFWKNFGKVLKEGLHFDFQNREKLQELALFESNATEPGTFVALKEYVGRMPDGQQEIYYIAGENRAAVAGSPHLEAFKAKGYEVLFFTDAIDEWVVQGLTEYDGKKLRPVDRGAVELDGEDEKEAAEAMRKEQAERLKGLLECLGKHLEDEVKEVRLSTRLTDSVSCLVADELGMSPNMERIYKAMNQEVAPSKRGLEINATHPLIERMYHMHADDPEQQELRDFADLVYCQALITEGSPLKDPARFTRLVSNLMLVGAPPADAPVSESTAKGDKDD